MIELIILSKAESEIQGAFEKAESYQDGRGTLFLQQLDASFTLLRKFPEMAPVYSDRYRRLLLRDLPYGLFYQVQPTRVITVALLDLRQNPDTIVRRLQ